MVFNKIRIFRLKKKVKNNPYIGTKESNGTYIYRQGLFTIEYEILNIQTPRPLVKIISIKHRLTESEIARHRIKELFRNLFRYQTWIYLLRPHILISFILGIAILYFGIIEPYQNKVDRFRWIVASVVGVSPQDIQYIGNGWLQISAQRKTAVDRISEPVRYTFNPLRWLFTSESGSVTRWRGRPYGYVTHPIVYNEDGEVWINKEYTWRHGRISGKTIEWDEPQGSGIRAGKVTGHEITTQDKKLRLPDE